MVTVLGWFGLTARVVWPRGAGPGGIYLHPYRCGAAPQMGYLPLYRCGAAPQMGGRYILLLGPVSDAGAGGGVPKKEGDILVPLPPPPLADSHAAPRRAVGARGIKMNILPTGRHAVVHRTKTTDVFQHSLP